MHIAIKQQGFTLIELVLFIVIVGIAVGAISTQFAQNVQHSAEPLLRQKALAIAHSHMDKIQGLAFTDVVGYTDSSVSGFTVTVAIDNTVTWTATSPAETIPAAATKKVTIVVANAATGESLNFTLYRVNY